MRAGHKRDSRRSRSPEQPRLRLRRQLLQRQPDVPRLPGECVMHPRRNHCLPPRSRAPPPTRPRRRRCLTASRRRLRTTTRGTTMLAALAMREVLLRVRGGRQGERRGRLHRDAPAPPLLWVPPLRPRVPADAQAGIKGWVVLERVVLFLGEGRCRVFLLSGHAALLWWSLSP